MGQWVKVSTQIHLSNDNDGHVRIWQDGNLIVDANGATLPLRSAIYRSKLALLLTVTGARKRSFGSMTFKCQTNPCSLS